MTIPDDPWMQLHSTIDPLRAHALGIVSVWWNHCERIHLRIFSQVLGIDREKGWIVGHDIGDVSLSEKINEALHLSQFDREWRLIITNYLACYDRCRQNRNVLSHFVAVLTDESNGELAAAGFIRVKGIKGTTTVIPSSIDSLRRVAGEIHLFALYSWNLHKALDALRQGRRQELLKTFPIPELLVKPPPQTHPKPTRPPRSSRASRKARKSSPV